LLIISVNQVPAVSFDFLGRAGAKAEFLRASGKSGLSHRALEKHAIALYQGSAYSPQCQLSRKTRTHNSSVPGKMIPAEHFRFSY